MNKAPSKVQWQRVVLECLALDYLTCKLHSEDDVFGKTWQPLSGIPWLEYLYHF